MKIGKRELRVGPPYIVAEISGNHCGEIDKAIQLIEVAKWAGADAVKTQCYTPDTITLNCDRPDFLIKEGPWKDRSLYDLYTRAHTPFDWHPELYRYARSTGIEIFSSVFDYTALALLEELDCPAYKIASMEITDIPLIEAVARTGKPMIISTGMATDGEVGGAFEAAVDADANDIGLLHCVSGYPTPIEQSNLWRIGHLYEMWPRLIIGVSDHSLGREVPMMATAMGSRIIEKHLCLSRDDVSEDADFSLEPGEFKAMVAAAHQAWAACRYNETKSEDSSRQLRRSLYVVQDMQKGEAFSPENIRSIRPGYGLPPEHLNKIVGRVAIADIARGTALTAALIK